MSRWCDLFAGMVSKSRLVSFDAPRPGTIRVDKRTKKTTYYIHSHGWSGPKVGCAHCVALLFFAWSYEWVLVELIRPQRGTAIENCITILEELTQ